MLIRPSQHQFEFLFVDARIVCGAGKEILPRNHGLNGRDRVRGYIGGCCDRILDGQLCFDCLDFLDSESRIHRFENFYYCII
jgi:hypothetical protein